jgi:hypothetical protein
MAAILPPLLCAGARRPPTHVGSGPLSVTPRRQTAAPVPHSLPQLLPSCGVPQTGPPLFSFSAATSIKMVGTTPHSPFLSFLLSEPTARAPSHSPRPLVYASGQTTTAPHRILGHRLCRSPSTVSSAPCTSPLWSGDPSPSPPQAAGAP